MTVDRQPFSLRPLLAVLLLGGMASTVAAQGGVRGIVRDDGGVGIPGARVVAESLETPQTRTTTTNGSGRFAFIGIAGGDWVFVIQADGFREEQGYSVVRRSGRPVRLDFTLELDPFNPVAPSVGVLAGLKSADILARLRTAERLFDAGNYDGALDVYRAILESGAGHDQREPADRPRLAGEAGAGAGACRLSERVGGRSDESGSAGRHRRTRRGAVGICRERFVYTGLAGGRVWDLRAGRVAILVFSPSIQPPGSCKSIRGVATRDP